MDLSPGTTLGPYKIVAPLGAGGMGEVYRARDTRLGRDVALKILPESFAREADRLHRFEQEARAVAALNHPSIIFSLCLTSIGTTDHRFWSPSFPKAKASTRAGPRCPAPAQADVHVPR
jgi:serine/threonine protein kinase